MIEAGADAIYCRLVGDGLGLADELAVSVFLAMFQFRALALNPSRHTKSRKIIALSRYRLNSVNKLACLSRSLSSG